MKEKFEYKSESIKVTVSTGVSCFFESAENSEELIRCADVALYTAKNSGRNKVIVYKKEIEDKIGKD